MIILLLSSDKVRTLSGKILKIRTEMKAFILFCMIFGGLVCVQGLKCMSCYSSSDFEDCNVNGHIQQCTSNQLSCETVVRRYNDHMTVMKGCKDERACKDNQLQNTRYSGRSTQCNSDQTNSVCTCCCSTSMCNIGVPTCTDYYAKLTPVNDCQETPTVLPHGNIECYANNKAGSVCEYECTGKDYSVWPRGRLTNVCLGNGSWAYEQPCCARPCPPYYLLDDIQLFHATGDDAEKQLQKMLEFVVYGVIANDAIKISTMYYSGEPIESSVVKFNEYGENATLLMELVRQRTIVENKGKPSAGKAIQYALDNLFVPEAGMRDSRAPKSLGIVTNTNLGADAKGPAEEARRRGYIVYVNAYQTGEVKFDRESLVEITGDEELVYIFDDDIEAITTQTLAVMNKYFCRNPCDHVMHEHQ